MHLHGTVSDSENGLSVAFCFIVACAHEKINILVSVLNIIFILYYDVRSEYARFCIVGIS